LNPRVKELRIVTNDDKHGEKNSDLVFLTINPMPRQLIQRFLNRF
jgi:hypothetical protein